MQKLMSRMRAAMQKYDMISDGDRIAVGISGGKDSVVLLSALCEMQRFYPKKYEIFALTLDPRFGNIDTDYSEITNLCASYGVQHRIRRTELARIIFEVRNETNPCSLCARMRRGILHDEAKAIGCNKLALGHHMDDAAETFMMNLLVGGNIDCFAPVTYLSRKDLYMIRPMVLAREGLITAVVTQKNLPIIKNLCPMDNNSERKRMKELIDKLEIDYPHLRDKMIGAMQRGNLNNW